MTRVKGKSLKTKPKPPGRENVGYSLTDLGIRESLSGRGGTGLPPPLSKISWPLWEEALLSPDPKVHEPALFLLANPVLNEDAFHYRFLARRADRLAALWSATGRPELLGLMFRMIGASAEEKGPAWPPDNPSGAEQREGVWRALRGVGGEMPVHLINPEYIRVGAIRDWIGEGGTISPDLLSAVEELFSSLGEKGFAARGRRIREMIRQGEYESACQEGGPAWYRLIEAACPAPRPGSEPGRILIWGGLDGRAFSFFEGLLEAWAGELAEVNRICNLVSQRTGRLVVALFNANRAATLGWGLDRGEKNSSRTWPPETGGGGMADPPLDTAESVEAAGKLKRMWYERLARPALKQTLAELSDWFRFNGREEEFGPLLARSPHTGGFEPGEIFGHSRPFTLLPRSSLERKLERVLALIDQKTSAWGPALFDWLVRAGVHGSERRLAGSQPQVMGLTDKFSASTSAGQDRDYLALWVGLLRRTAPESILLLFDDTSRERAHLARTVAEIPDCIGLGPYGGAGEDDPAGLITAQASPGRLFVLRIRPRRGKKGNLVSWLENPSPSLLRPGVYDPAWRDGLDPILSGTPQEVLAGPPQPISPSIVTQTGLWPLGSYCRRRLRSLIPPFEMVQPVLKQQ